MEYLTNDPHDTPLHRAAADNDLRMLESLLNANPQAMYVRNKSGLTPLHISAPSPQTLSCLCSLLQFGCKPDVTDTIFDETPLHLAVRGLNLEGVKRLLAKGADVARGNKNGDTPLHIAAHLCDRKLVKVLLRHAANPNLPNSAGETPLQIAARQKCPELVQLMKQQRTSPLKREPTTGAIKAWDKQRRHKIRQKIEAAKSAGESEWFLLFQDFDASSARSTPNQPQVAATMSNMHSTGTMSNSTDRPHRSKNRQDSERRLVEMSNSLPKARDSDKSVPRLPVLSKHGHTVYIDLRGKVHKTSGGDPSIQPVDQHQPRHANQASQQPPLACFCTPFMRKLAKQNARAHKALLDEIDACRHELSHELSDLKHLTENRLAQILRPPFEKSPDSCNNNQPLHRWHSESEIDLDPSAEINQQGGQHAHMQRQSLRANQRMTSSPIDDLYLERYWHRPLKVQSARADQRREGSENNNDSGQRLRCSDPMQASFMSQTKNARGSGPFTLSMHQFDQLALEDTDLTTPTTSGAEGCSLRSTSTSRSNGSSGPCDHRMHQKRRTMDSQPPMHHQTDQHQAVNMQEKKRLASSQIVAAPSLDSGYGTATVGSNPNGSHSGQVENSPSPRSASGSQMNSLTRSITSEACTQTDTSNQSQSKRTIPLGVAARRPRIANASSIQNQSYPSAQHYSQPPLALGRDRVGNRMEIAHGLGDSTDTDQSHDSDWHEYCELSVAMARTAGIRHSTGTGTGTKQAPPTQHQGKPERVTPVLRIPPPPRKPLPPVPVGDGGESRVRVPSRRPTLARV